MFQLSHLNPMKLWSRGLTEPLGSKNEKYRGAIG